MKGRIKIIIFLGVIFILAFMIVSQEKIPSFFAGKYKMNGIDVSHYQGDIDWEIIEGQGIDFAFIKATEGSSHIDPCFEKIGKRQSRLPFSRGHIIFSALTAMGMHRRSILLAQLKV